MADKALATWPAVAAQASGAYTGFLGPTTDADVAAAYPADAGAAPASSSTVLSAGG